jgi:hypothetical protein
MKSCYIWACAANCAAVNADTSSAAGTTPVVGPSAAAFPPALTTEPILCTSPTAAPEHLGLGGHIRHLLS